MPAPPPVNLSSAVTLSPHQISSTLGDEIVIMNHQTGVYHGVQGVSAFVWNLLAQPISVQNICDRVIAEYNVDPPRAQADVLNLLNQLLQEGLVVLVDSPEKVSLP
jgi:Coenzyme PQQ synthesis protein D (PqqD)